MNKIINNYLSRMYYCFELLYKGRSCFFIELKNKAIKGNALHQTKLQYHGFDMTSKVSLKKGNDKWNENRSKLDVLKATDKRWTGLLHSDITSNNIVTCLVCSKKPAS